MFWKIRSKTTSLQFRLNLLISGAFLFSSLLVFLVVGMMLRTALMNRKDRELRNDTSEFIEHYKSFGLSGLLSDLKDEALTSDADKDFYCLLTDGNKELFHFGAKFSPMAMNALISNQDTYVANKFMTVKVTNSFPMRICYHKLTGGTILIVGSSTEDVAGILEEFREVFYRTVFFVLVCALFIGWIASKRAVSGIRIIAHAAEQLEKGNLSHRVNAQVKGLELVELSNAFNRMADRIQSTLLEMEQVTGNVAHDLKSPLTRIRGVAEAALFKGNSPERNDVPGLVIEECDRMMNIIDTMLDIARINAGATEMDAVAVDIGDVLDSVVDIFQPVAEDSGVTIKLGKFPESVIVSGDLQRLQRLFANLVDNAIKYSGIGKEVTLTLIKSNGYAEVKVQDQGIGIPEEELSRIFNRFYRCESSRSTPGSGLGLSLAQAISQAHHGEITVQSIPGEGSTFAVRLPLFQE